MVIVIVIVIVIVVVIVVTMMILVMGPRFELLPLSIAPPSPRSMLSKSFEHRFVQLEQLAVAASAKQLHSRVD